jgi:hypothetical protein
MAETVSHCHLHLLKLFFLKLLEAVGLITHFYCCQPQELTSIIHITAMCSKEISC